MKALSSLKLSGKENKKLKKNTPAFEKFMSEQREKLSVQRFKG